MGSYFPALPSGNNPSVSAAAQAASSAGSIFNALQSAADQHASLMQRDQQAKAAALVKANDDSYKDENTMRAKNAIPSQIQDPDTPAVGGAPGTKPTLMGQIRNPAASGGGYTQTDPQGRSWYVPSQDEQDASKLNDTNSVTFSDALAAEAQKAGLSNVRSGMRYPKAELESLNQRLAAWHKQNDPEPETFTYNDKDFVDENGKNVLAMQGNRGTVKRATIQQSSPGAAPGGPFDQSQNGDFFEQPGQGPLPGGPTNANAKRQGSQPAQPGAANPGGGLSFALPEKPEKADRFKYDHFTNDSGAVTVTRIGPDDSVPEKWDGKAQKWIALGASENIGPKRKDPGTAGVAGDRGLTAGQEGVQNRFDARELRAATTKKHDRLAKAETEFGKDVMGAGTDVSRTNAARSKLVTEKQGAQDEYEESLKNMGLNVTHFDYGAQAPKGDKQQPAKPADPLGVRP